MLPCSNCKWREPVRFSTQTACSRNWHEVDRERLREFGDRIHDSVPAHAWQWFHFPLDYDPVWGPNECPGYENGDENA